MAEQQRSSRITDPKVMRALAHPARISILEYLTSTGDVVTATQCADLVGLSPSATSYHLRELAKVGLVEQAPSRGDGRERVWQSRARGVSIDADFDEPESVAAERALVDVWVARSAAKLQEWWERQGAEPREWREAAQLNLPTLLVTLEELTAINAQVKTLIEPYLRRERNADPPPGARVVALQYAAFPTDEAPKE
ncbi:ArsR/SmtB family transcription factor [Winogradskya humida]|uniref:Transcriptional regulator n=1 Tax=Winogradskya humida TaxID=113566 RepID=A0ABQ3ZLZ4_9ACTN|nr:winged helix-turn-helix domain-containing protein [Actinoplanes humidus]GIE19601.1 transcriptional regulator [Actinoplanes humidus]